MSRTSTLAQAPAAKPAVGDFYKAVAAENYGEAKRQADAMLPQLAADEKLKISLAYGRVLLGLNQKEPARQYLTLMGKQTLPGDGPRLLQVYAAWLAALDGKQDEALKSLEGLLEQKVHGVATAEAADVLAMLYMAKGDQVNAKRAVDFGLEFISYSKLTTDYTETLLRGRLGSTIASPDAEKLYVAAEKLRQEGKFVEAGRMFNQVVQQHSKTEWIHPAQFRIGQCLMGLSRSVQAQEHWNKFVAALPAGPWRGQARVALIDIVLAMNGDLLAASEHSLAATTALGQSLEKEAEKSWKEAAFDIRIRHGVIALVDSRFDAAIAALKQAQQHAPQDARLAAGLNRLIEAAEKRTPLLPQELRAGESKTVLALSLGTIFNMLRQFDVARRVFSVPLASKSRSGSAPHRSFAAFGMARAVAGLVQPGHAPESSGSKQSGSSPPTFAEAKALYRQSLKEHASGSWHDETLRDLALLIERMAADKFDTKPRIENPAANTKEKSANKPAARLTDAQRQEQAQQRTAARAEALLVWTELPKQFPSSRHVPQALYHAGMLLSESDKPAEALAAFAELVKRYPDSPWTGDAQVWLIDVKLEQQFDLPGAATLAASAITWYEKLDQAAVAQARKGYAEDEAQGLRTLQQTGYAIYLRAGLTEYLQDRRDQALAFFAKATPLQPPRTFEVVHGTIPTGIERLIEVAKTDKLLTPEEVRAGDEKAKLILMLADVYFAGEQWNKSLELCAKVVGNNRPSISREQRSWAYFRRGRSLYCSTQVDDDQQRASEADYLTSANLASTAPWASDALFLAANVRWNFQRNADGAIRLWSELLSKYPDSLEADRSAYFVCIAYEWSERPYEAISAFQSFLEERGDSKFASLARRHLAKLKSQHPKN